MKKLCVTLSFLGVTLCNSPFISQSFTKKHEGSQRFQKPYPYFKKDVDLYPFTYDYLLMYAWTSFQLGKSREAKVLFNKVLMLSPEDTSALEGLGLIEK